MAGVGVWIAVEWILLGSDAVSVGVGVAVCVTIDGQRRSGVPAIMRWRETVPILRNGAGATGVGEITRSCTVLSIFGALGGRDVALRRMRKVLVH